MKTKRSIGVTIFGWLFIISGTLGLLSTLNPHQYIQFYGIVTYLFSIIISVANLVCGIFILKLNPQAPKIAVILCLIGIISIPFYIKRITKSLNYEDAFEKEKQKIIEQLKPEYQQKALENLEKSKEISKKFMPGVLMLVFGVPFALLEFIPIYFFTRPKVKALFSPPEPNT